MRARGSRVTDVAVIVVAADDGVQPQTVEAINHAKAAGVPLVVALNKIDKPDVDIDRVMRQLAENNVQVEDYGGEIGMIRTSAHSGQGIPELLERLALETEVRELRANHGANASGTVLEAHRDEDRGIIVTLLVQRGSLFVGDVVVAGVGYGKVRSLMNWKGEKVDLAGPSHAVEITGLDEVPRAGDRFQVVDDLRQAADVAEERRQKKREKELAARQKTTTAASLFGDIATSKKKELKVVVKADAAGSLEVLNKTIGELTSDEVRLSIIHSGVGAITSSDIQLAEASKAVVIGFHVIADSKARSLAENLKVDVRSYTIIYEMLDELRSELGGMLEPVTRETVIGQAEVRKTFVITKVGVVAGLYISRGICRRDAFMRITRENRILHVGKVGTLRRFKEDVKEVREAFECGLTVEGFQDIQVGDLMEFYIKEKIARIVEK
jgi:translation initiation factor IF-2